MKNTVKKLLAVILAGIMVVSLASCSVGDKIRDYFNEETTVTEPQTNKSEKPDDQVKTIEYFNTVSSNLKKSNPYNIILNRGFEAKDFESQNATLKAMFPTVSKFFINNSTFIDKEINGRTALEEGKISNIVHVYPMEASMQASNVLLKQVKLATTAQTTDYYIITIDFTDDATPFEAGGLGEVFNVNDKAAILEELKGASDMFVIKDYTAEYNGGKIVCTVDRTTDQIISTTYTRVIKITAEITGQGEFADIKNETVTFNLTENEHYEIEWNEGDLEKRNQDKD